MLQRMAGRRGGRDDGMSLIEVVVAMVVLAIVATAVLGVIFKAQAAGVNNRGRIAAANLAAREIDILRERFGRSDTAPVEIADEGVQVNANPIDPTAAPGDPLVVDGTPYTVTRSTSWDITGGGQSACEGGSLVKYPTLSVAVSVTWPGMGTTQPVVSYAKFTPAKGTGVPGTASFIAVGVVDAAGDPSPNQPVKVTGPSETRTGTTDPSGCAVIQVNPPATGATYTAELTNTGYVDVNNSANPSRIVGNLGQGQLNNSVTFAYDRAITLRVRVVDASGNLVPDATAAGSQITLSAVGMTGEDVTTTMAMTSAVTDLTGLWPTTYGAYYGTTAPPGGYATVAVPPGGTGQLDVELQLASASIVGMPSGTTTVIAAPTGSTCTAAGARVVDPAGFSLVPGSYDFFATGPGFTCSPGPSGQNLASGPNDGIEWNATTLTVTGAPADGVLWAVSSTKVAGTLTTCPTGADASTAISVDGARTGPVAVPAGDWYVFRTDGAATGACLGTPSGQYPTAVPYGTNTTIGWAELPLTTTLTSTNVNWGIRVILSTAPVSSCGSYSFSTSGTNYVLGPASYNGASLTGSVTRPASGTTRWYAYQWSTYYRWCGYAGSFYVGTTTTSLTKSISDTGSVGP